MTEPGTPHAELAALRERLIDCEQRLATLPAYQEEARLTAAERDELGALRERVDTLEAELAQAQELRARAERVNEEMQASVSWRITAPLRAFKRRS